MNSQFQFLRPYLRGWIIIAGAMVLAYLMATKYLSYVTPMYESTAKLRLADLNEGVPNSNLFKDFDVFANTQKIQSEIELIQSNNIIKKAIKKLPFSHVIQRAGKFKSTELLHDAPFVIENISLSASHYNKVFLLTIHPDSSVDWVSPEGKKVVGRIGDDITMGDSRWMIQLNQKLFSEKKEIKWADQYEITFWSEERLIGEILKNLDVTSVDKDVPVIRISYKSANPEKAALVPNALAEAYIEDYIDTKYKAANVTVDFLNAQINDISSKLSGSEIAILNYRERNDITNIRQETETDLRKISQLKIQQTNLKMNLDAIKDLENYVENGRGNFLELAPNFEAFTDLLSTEMVKKIKQLQAEKKDLLLQYTPNDEKVKTIDEKIADITSYLTESIRNTRKNLQTKYNNLVGDIEAAEEVFVTVPEKEKMMTILNREFEIYQQSYNFLNQKKIEAEIAKAAKVAFHRIITPATVGRNPVSPNYTIIKAVSVILGMMGAIFLIFIVHSLKARVNNVSTIESNSMVPIASTIPKLKSKDETEHFFIRMLTQWKVKGLLKKQSLTCFTGYDARQGIAYITSRLIPVLKAQHSTLLLIEIQEGWADDKFYHIDKEDGTDRLTLYSDSMNHYTIEEIQNTLVGIAKSYDYALMINTPFGEKYTLAIMAIASLNLVGIDTRLTPAKKLTEIDLMMNEYQLPAMYYLVNRVGYQPGFLREVEMTIKKLILFKKQVKLKTT